jgi:DNA helicase-2/ATP-dependent DNA helicase PcrA
MSAWKELSRDISGHIGRNAPLDQFLQELQIRSKEPSPKADTVTLMTVHGAKGRESEFGLASPSSFPATLHARFPIASQ